MRRLWLLTGGNGAGKSTFHRLFLGPGVYWINADELALGLNPARPEDASYEAAMQAHKMRYESLNQGQSFCTETVFSHESKLEFIETARNHGYHIVLIYIHLASADLNVARVKQRVSESGHDVPEQKIRSRLPRVQENVHRAIAMVDETVLYDNSSFDQPFLRVAKVAAGQVTAYVDPLPDWAIALLK